MVGFLKSPPPPPPAKKTKTKTKTEEKRKKKNFLRYLGNGTQDSLYLSQRATPLHIVHVV